MQSRPPTLDAAVELTRTGDLWLFRGRTPADRAIQAATNAPVNHVGMAITLEDLPPLLLHAELGRSLQDLWSGEFRRGVQVHDLRAAVDVWRERYRQRAWLRQLDVPADRTQADPAGQLAERRREDAALTTVARLSGTPFPSAARLAGRWLSGRVTGRASRWRRRPASAEPDDGSFETAYCAEVVAAAYQAMGLLAVGPVNWFDPGRFWSGDDLELLQGARLGAEIEVPAPAA